MDGPADWLILAAAACISVLIVLRLLHLLAWGPFFLAFLLTMACGTALYELLSRRTQHGDGPRS